MPWHVVGKQTVLLSDVASGLCNMWCMKQNDLNEQIDKKCSVVVSNQLDDLDIWKDLLYFLVPSLYLNF